MKNTWEPTVAGILGILSGLLYFIPWMVIAFVPEDAELEQRELAGMLGLLIILFSPSVLLAFVAGICALVRRALPLALVCLIIFFFFQLLSFSLTRQMVGAGAPPIVDFFGILGSVIGIIIPLAAVGLLVASRD